MRAVMLLLAVLLMACGAAPPADSGGRIPIAVSVAPQADLVERIGGGRVSVEVMIPPGSSDEEISLSPRKAMALERIRLYVKVGHPAFAVEARSIDPFLSQRPDIRVVDMSRGMDLIEEMEEHGGHGHEGDPHVWTAPGNVAVAARNIAAALAEADPANAAGYRANLARLLEEVGHLDGQIRARLAAPGADRRFLVYHPSWGYFARQYGLEQIAIEAEGKEPGAAGLIRIVERARQEGARVVLVPGGSRESARVIADEIGGRMVPADAQARDWQATLLRIADALGEGSNHG